MEAELQDRVVAALDDEADWMGVAERLRRSAGARDVDPVWGIIEAFDYDLKDRSQSEQRERYGGPFGPMIETTAGAYPTLLSEVKDDRLQLWGELFDAVDHPLVRARFGDLIWSRRGGGPAPYRRALAAAEAYVVLADRQGWHAVDRATCLSRALELARELNNPDRRERVIEQIRIAARTSMAATEPQPGVALRLIDALCALPRRDQPAELDDLLDVAAETYEGNPFIHEAVVDLQLARVRDDPDQVKELARKQIATWRAVADRQPGLIRLTHLQRALELARTYGLQPEMEDLRLAVQAISEDDLDLQTISAEIEIPRARIEAFLASFFDGDSWTDWLSRFGAHCPLQEPRDRTVEQVERLIQEHPFQYLMTRVILSPENIPIRIVSTEGEQRQAAIVEWDMRAIVLWAIWAGDVLNDVAVRQRPTVEELTQHFTTEIIPAEVAERVAAAVDHFWEGRYDEALFVLLPRLEAIIRQLCRQLGLVITKEPMGTEAGGFLQLGALLFALTGRLPESRRCYLTTLLTDPIGFNLRNRGLHGLIASGTREDAALAIHAACFLQQVKLEARWQT